ncbi:MAG: alpha/beta hydrolase [Casimicrobiaceae bacterium]
MPVGLEVRSALPRSRRGPALPPLLFVHGAYCDAWCWSVNILPWFADKGYEAHALSLRGHGKSPGLESLDSATLDEYVSDVREVAAELSSPPILIGHSMGAALVERAIALDAYPGAALVCPVPPSGLLPVLTRLWWGRPDFFWQAQNMQQGMFDPVSLSTLREFYFTSNVPRNLLADALAHFSPESSRAVMQLAWRSSSARLDDNDTPTCVIAAGADALFTVADAEATARRHGTSAVVLDELPHMLMLEAGWEKLAATLDDWIRASSRKPKSDRSDLDRPR